MEEQLIPTGITADVAYIKVDLYMVTTVSRAPVTFIFIFDSEDEGIRFFRNIGNCLEDCRVRGRTLQPEL
jgi:hypothetical protein